MLGIDTTFFILELGVGLYVGSLALMADAFHMLNDIISLVVGLWAVKAAQQHANDKFSFGFLRAEILGAFFNAVFLIALCVSILLEAVTRLIEVPVVTNPQLILIVGCLGLTSNLTGFFVLGGHGHSHGPEGHSHDEHSHAEEGHAHSHAGHDHSHAEEADEDELASSVFAENVVARAKKQGHIRFDSTEDNATKASSPSHNRSGSKGSRKHRRRTSSIRNNRFSTLEDISIHPTTFRQNIIAASRSPVDETESSDNGVSDEEAVADGDAPTETSPLLSQLNGNDHKHSHDDHDHDDDHSHTHSHAPKASRTSSSHAKHNHNKPKKASKGGHGHNHADMGMNGMILHVIGDALGNVGVIVSALIIWLTNWSGRYYADPAVSLFITLIILKSAIPLTSATAKILLQATPDHIDVQDIKEDIQELDGVLSCHHVHIWQLSDTQLVASMHVQVSFPISEASSKRYMDLAKAARECLHAYGIHSATIQPEFCTDEAHDHGEGVLVGLDGVAGQARCRLDDDDCLLECVDNCAAKKCCDTSTAASESGHSDHGHRH